MEFENSPAITDRDRAQATAPRLRLEPLHADVRLLSTEKVEQQADEPGQGRVLEFDSEMTSGESTQVASNDQPTGERHHVAMIASCAVCALFISGVIFMQLQR